MLPCLSIVLVHWAYRLALRICRPALALSLCIGRHVRKAVMRGIDFVSARAMFTSCGPKQYPPTYLFNWTDIQKIDHAVLHVADGQNKVLFDF